MNVIISGKFIVGHPVRELIPLGDHNATAIPVGAVVDVRVLDALVALPGDADGGEEDVAVPRQAPQRLRPRGLALGYLEGGALSPPGDLGELGRQPRPVAGEGAHRVAARQGLPHHEPAQVAGGAGHEDASSTLRLHLRFVVWNGWIGFFFRTIRTFEAEIFLGPARLS